MIFLVYVCWFCGGDSLQGHMRNCPKYNLSEQPVDRG